MSGHFERKYAVEWYELIETAHFDRGVSVAQAVRDAAEGKLEGQTEPFEMSIHAARKHIGREKKRRDGRELTRKQQGTPAERAEAVAGRTLAIVEHETAKLENRSGKGKLTPDDADLGRKLMMWAEATLRMQKSAPAGPRDAGKKPAQPRQAPDPPSPTLAGMIKDHGREQQPKAEGATDNGQRHAEKDTVGR